MSWDFGALPVSYVTLLLRVRWETPSVVPRSARSYLIAATKNGYFYVSVGFYQGEGVTRLDEAHRSPHRAGMLGLRAHSLGFALGALLFVGTSRADGDSASNLDVVEFKTATRNANGVVRCGLFERKGWLKKPVRSAVAKINGRDALCKFSRVPKGEYGISAFHDENSNGKLDTNLLGMPTEDYCASRNARGTFGPPSFDDAKFKYSGGAKRLEALMQ